MNLFLAEHFHYSADRNEYTAEISELERVGQLAEVIHLSVADCQPERFAFHDWLYHNGERMGWLYYSDKGANMTIFND